MSFVDTIDTPKEAIEQHGKRECLKCHKQGQSVIIRTCMGTRKGRQGQRQNY